MTSKTIAIFQELTSRAQPEIVMVTEIKSNGYEVLDKKEYAIEGTIKESFLDSLSNIDVHVILEPMEITFYQYSKLTGWL